MADNFINPEIYLNFALDKIRRFRVSTSNRLSHVCTYVRELPISLDRMYENALDGEHLPYVHSSTFSTIEMVDSGSWGWRAKLGMTPNSRFTKMEVQLTLDRERNRWKTKTLAGLGKGTEIWTHAIPIDDNNIKVVVDFYVPKLPRLLKSMYTKYYMEVYETLYDEDLMMMEERQQALDYKAKSNAQSRENGKLDSMSLGHEKELLKTLPTVFELNKQRYCLAKVNGNLIAYSATCPHMLGPLDDAKIDRGVVECPWHGYKFNVKDGKCLTGQRCRLKPAPIIKVCSKTGEVTANLHTPG